MEQKWKYKQYLGLDLPEHYSLRLQKDHHIEVKAHSLKGIVKIRITNPERNVFESTISNGVVIDERDVKANKSRFLESFFRSYRKELNSLPDQLVLKIIGGNYSVLADLSEEIQRKKQPKAFKISDFFHRIYAKILRGITGYFKAIIQKPKFCDVFDVFLAILAGSLTYYQNFDYLASGALTAGTAVFSGYYDWMVRKRHPFLVKILVLFVAGSYLVYIGFSYQ